MSVDPVSTSRDMCAGWWWWLRSFFTWNEQKKCSFQSKGREEMNSGMGWLCFDSISLSLSPSLYLEKLFFSSVFLLIERIQRVMKQQWPVFISIWMLWQDMLFPLLQQKEVRQIRPNFGLEPLALHFLMGSFGRLLSSALINFYPTSICWLARWSVSLFEFPAQSQEKNQPQFISRSEYYFP